MKIHLCDRLWNRFGNPPSAWHRALLTKTVFDSSTAIGENHPPAVHSAYANADAIIFVHTDFSHEWTEKANETTVVCQIVFVRGDGGEAAQASSKGNLHGCYWSPTQVERDDPSEIAELMRKISIGAPDWHKFLQPTFVPENVLSWALLEAYGRGNEKSKLLQEGIEDAALKELRERSGNASLRLTLDTAKDELARYREDV